MSTFFVIPPSPRLAPGSSGVTLCNARDAQGAHGARATRRRAGVARASIVARAIVTILAFAVSGGVVALHAANSSKQPKDSGPVLMSRTGGGNQWANVKELQAAAANGNPRAEAQLGELLLRGEGIAKDESRAVSLLEKAARAGNSSAAFRIGMLLMHGESGVAKDPPRALAYFRAAAAGGEKEAFFNIGAAYGSARGVRRDYGEALGWLIVARQRGADASAESNLRAQIKAQSSWIARGERRAKEIEQEFTGKKVVEFLPPEASLAVPYTPEPEIQPSAAAKEPVARPTFDLRPSMPAKTDDSLRPSLPSLPPPTIPRP